MTTAAIVVGSRGSDLALWQSRWVASRLPGASEVKVLVTQGDRIVDRDLRASEGKGFFTKELEDALLNGSIDVAVHSLKDLPTRSPPGLVVAAIPERAPVADLLLVRDDAYDASRPIPVRAGASVGASSLRRQVFTRWWRPDLSPVSLRGNVPTRVLRLREGKCDAILLAEAGLRRLSLDLSGLHVFRLEPRVWWPAAGQGALGIQVREGSAASSVVATLDDADVRAAVEAERSLLAAFDGGCHLPLGAWARREGDGWAMDAAHAPDADSLVKCSVSASDASQLPALAFAELQARTAAHRFEPSPTEVAPCTRIAGWS